MVDSKLKNDNELNNNSNSNNNTINTVSASHSKIYSFFSSFAALRTQIQVYSVCVSARAFVVVVFIFVFGFGVLSMTDYVPNYRQSHWYQNRTLCMNYLLLLLLLFFKYLTHLQTQTQKQTEAIKSRTGRSWRQKEKNTQTEDTTAKKFPLFFFVDFKWYEYKRWNSFISNISHFECRTFVFVFVLLLVRRTYIMQYTCTQHTLWFIHTEIHRERDIFFLVFTK